jgi:hypothetical protein
MCADPTDEGAAWLLVPSWFVPDELELLSETRDVTNDVGPTALPGATAPTGVEGEPEFVGVVLAANAVVPPAGALAATGGGEFDAGEVTGGDGDVTGGGGVVGGGDEPEVTGGVEPESSVSPSDGMPPDAGGELVPPAASLPSSSSPPDVLDAGGAPVAGAVGDDSPSSDESVLPPLTGFADDVACESS